MQLHLHSIRSLVGCFWILLHAYHFSPESCFLPYLRKHKICFTCKASALVVLLSNLQESATVFKMNFFLKWEENLNTNNCAMFCSAVLRHSSPNTPHPFHWAPKHLHIRLEQVFPKQLIVPRQQVGVHCWLSAWPEVQNQVGIHLTPGTWNHLDWAQAGTNIQEVHRRTRKRI